MEAMLNTLMPFLVGSLFAGVAGFLWWRDKKLRRECTAQTAGVVSDVDHTVRYKKGKRRNEYRTTFTYTVDGVEYTKCSSLVTSVPKFSVGQSVTVFYDSAKPQRYYVLEEGKAVAIVLVFGILGLLLILVGIFLKILG